MQKLAYGIGFFSAASFLSNFYDCEVTYKSTSYKTLEHGYQACKAEVCKNEHAYNEILRAGSHLMLTQ